MNLKRIDIAKKFKRLIRLFSSFSLKKMKPIGKPPYRINLVQLVRLHTTDSRKEVSLRINHHQLTTSDSYWFPINFREIFEDEIYKFETDKDCPLIFDCGSNIGLSVLFFKSNFPNSKIIAYEPDPYLFGLLQKNLAPYNFENLELHQQAVWIEETTLRFHQDRSLGGCLISHDSQKQTINVPTVRLRDKIIDEVDLLKIDIEGAEFDVLQDCSEQLKKVKRIFVEYHGSAKQNQQFRLLLEILEKNDFRYYIKEAYPVQHPFIKKEFKLGYDLQQNIFAFRV